MLASLQTPPVSQLCLPFAVSFLAFARYSLTYLISFNTGLLLESPSGRWCVYTSPMDGVKETSCIEIGFQQRIAASELSCCSTNGPRIFGQLCEWAVMLVPSAAVPTIAINYYGASTATVSHVATLVQTTEYPIDGAIKIAVTPLGPAEMELHLRIPVWSSHTTVTVNGIAVSGVVSGTYCAIRRAWAAGDVLSLELDFRLRGWIHDTDMVDVATTSSGPVDIAFDAFVLVNDGATDAPVPTWDSTKDGQHVRILFQSALVQQRWPHAAVLNLLAFLPTPQLCCFRCRFRRLAGRWQALPRLDDVD